MLDKLLESKLNELEQLQQEHLSEAMAMMKADNSALFAVDFFAISVFKRSMSLISGFTLLVKNQNFICAVPLLRMQIDNALRFHAIHLVDKPHLVAQDFIDGVPIKNFKDNLTNKNLTDSYLIASLVGKYPDLLWMKEVYKHTSGYIHLSEKHFFNTTHKKNEGEGNIGIAIGPQDSAITVEQRLEATNVMLEATHVVLWFLKGWTLTKEKGGIDRTAK